uniref:ORF138 n=1 Tax=Raphanus sativus TaxID=3726 RepID=Q9B9L5_RAPSA|nr:ORF138 [Raphanus sativus]
MITFFEKLSTFCHNLTPTECKVSVISFFLLAYLLMAHIWLSWFSNNQHCLRTMRHLEKLKIPYEFQYGWLGVKITIKSNVPNDEVTKKVSPIIKGEIEGKEEKKEGKGEIEGKEEKKEGKGEIEGKEEKKEVENGPRK